MTEISHDLERVAERPLEKIDWSRLPWVAAQPALAWLGVAPEVEGTTMADALVSESDSKAICDAMMLRFLDESGRLVWSSYMLHTAVKAVANIVGGPPEALLKSAWRFLADRELDKSVYEFCRAFGSEVRTQHGAEADWDLRWIQSSATPSQACLRYWILAVKPELWNGSVEEETMTALRASPFQF